MALIKFSAAIVDARGSIAGTTFSRNKSGAYIRARVKPVNPKSPRQELTRTIVSYLAELWHDPSMDVRRAGWETYAAAVAMKNGLAETIHLSGYNHFLRSNAPKLMIGLSEKLGAPDILSLPEKDQTVVCTEESIADQTFTLTCSVNGWAANGDPKYYIFLYQGQPQLISRQTFHGPWRYMKFFDAASGGAGTTTVAAAYAFAERQKVWFQARLLTVSGRLSEPWQINPRTIEADP